MFFLFPFIHFVKEIVLHIFRTWEMFENSIELGNAMDYGRLRRLNKKRQGQHRLVWRHTVQHTHPSTALKLLPLVTNMWVGEACVGPDMC